MPNRRVSLSARERGLKRGVDPDLNHSTMPVHWCALGAVHDLHLRHFFADQ
jgi:hypothetical protein